MVPIRARVTGDDWERECGMGTCFTALDTALLTVQSAILDEEPIQAGCAGRRSWNLSCTHVNRTLAAIREAWRAAVACVQRERQLALITLFRVRTGQAVIGAVELDTALTVWRGEALLALDTLMGIGVELKVYVTCVAQVFIAGDAVLDRLLPADAADSWRRVGAGDALGAGGHVGTARAVLYAGIGAQEKARSTLSAGVGLRAFEAPREGGWFGGGAADAGRY